MSPMAIIRFIRRFLRNESGPTSVEYAVMLAMIMLVAIGAVRVFGTTTNTVWQNSSNQLQSAGVGN